MPSSKKLSLSEIIAVREAASQKYIQSLKGRINMREALALEECGS